MALKLGELHTILKAKRDEFRQGLSDAKKEFQEHGQALGTMGAAAGAAIGVAMAAGIAGAMQMDKAKARLTAQLGGSAEYAADMGKIAGDVYMRGFGESAEAVGNTLRSVLSSGLLRSDATNAEIEAVTVKAQALADTFGQDVTGMARAAGQMVRTGLAKNSSEAFDILTRGFQKTGDHAGDLLDTFSEYSTQFRKLGISGAEATGIMVQGLKAGARDSDTIADTLKEFSIRAIDGSTAARDAYKALGLDADEMIAKIAKGGPSAQAGLQLVLDRLRAMKDPAAQSAAAVGLFGTKAEDMGAALYALDPSQAVDRLGNVAGAAEKVGQTLEQSASQKLEAFKRQAQGALVETMAAAIPMLTAVAGFLQQNSDVIGPLAVGLGALAIVIGTIIGVYKVWVAVQTALNIVQMLSPTTWIILGIVALIAIIVLIATKTTWFKQIWGAAWGWIKDKAAGVGRWFRDVLWKQWIVGSWNGIVSAGGRAVGWFKDLPGKIKSALVRVASFLTAPFRSGFNAIARLWNGTVGRMSFTVPSWVPGIGGNGFSMPRIPQLAKGGIVPATPGGRLVNVGEGGKDEAVIPIDRLASMLRNVVPEQAPGEVTEVRVFIGDQEIKRYVKYEVEKKHRDLRRSLGTRTAAAAR